MLHQGRKEVASSYPKGEGTCLELTISIEERASWITPKACVNALSSSTERCSSTHAAQCIAAGSVLVVADTLV